MSIIYSYPEQPTLNPNDMLIGSSVEKVDGKQKNVTRNFTVQQLADFIGDGGTIFNPAASDFQIGVFNQGGTKLTGSIMSQDAFPNGTSITISGNLSTTGNLIAPGVVTLGSGTNLITLASITKLGGPIQDSSGFTGNLNQILIANASGGLTWTNYASGLVYLGTWDADDNNPGLSSSVGTNSTFYIVNVAGNSDLNGITDWKVGDWAIFVGVTGSGGTWQKIDNSSVLTGQGTDNKIAMWEGGVNPSTSLTDSLISQNSLATIVTVTGALTTTGDMNAGGSVTATANVSGVNVTASGDVSAVNVTTTGTVTPTTITDKDSVTGTAGQILSSTETLGVVGIEWIDNQVGTVTGTGTNNTLPIWSDGAAGELGDSILNQVAAAAPFTDIHLAIQGSGGLSTQNLEINKSLWDGGAGGTTSAGTDGQILTSSTQGVAPNEYQEVKWVNPTTYTLSTAAKINSNVPLNLTDSSSNTTTVNLAEGAGITLTPDLNNGSIAVASTITQGITGSGTVNKLPKFGTTTSLTDSIVSETVQSAITLTVGSSFGVYGPSSLSPLTLPISLASDPFGTSLTDLSQFRLSFSNQAQADVWRNYWGWPAFAPPYNTNLTDITFTFTFSGGGTITFTQPAGQNAGNGPASVVIGWCPQCGGSTLNGTQLVYVSGSGSISSSDTVDVITATTEVNVAGDLTVTGKGNSSATDANDGSTTLVTKGYVDGLITGATIYRGAWDPDATVNNGYGSPNLSSVTTVAGYYYICSLDGAATPNGTGTEPNTWSVGDWVIYNDVSGTGQWQKIDNSSVLSGVGTGQTVALWQGADTVVDSETLGNAPITVSGNNTTFAGNIASQNLSAVAAAFTGDITFSGSADREIIGSSDQNLIIKANPTSGNAAQGIKLYNSASLDVSILEGGGVRFHGYGATYTPPVNDRAGTATWSLGVDVNGNIIQEPVVAIDTITGSGTVGYVPIFTAAGAIGNSETIFNDTTNDFIGIGTTTPGANLDVQSVTGTLRLGNDIGNIAAGAVVGKIEFSNVNTLLGPGVQAYIQSRAIDSGSTYAMDFFTGNKNNPTQTGLSLYSGNVGIGTTSPSKLLTIENTTTTSTIGDGESLRLSNPTQVVGNKNELGFSNFTLGQGYSSVILGTEVMSTSAYLIQDFYIATRSTSSNIAPTERLRIDSSGAATFSGALTATSGTFSDTLAFGSLKDTGENITITKFVDEADGLINNDNDTTIPTSAAVIDYVTATPGITNFNAIGFAMNYMSRVHDDGGVVEGMEQVMINTEKLILS